MTNDIRLHTTFFDHPKTVKLERKCGTEGVLALLRLWLWVRDNKPDGILGGEEDVEIAAKWSGDKGVLYSTLIEVGFLVKQTSGKTSLKNWAKRNPWAVGAVTRQLRAKKGGCAKHGKKCDECKDDCPNSTKTYCQQVLAPAPSPSPLLSSPSPTPKESIKTVRFKKPSLEEVQKYITEKGYDIDPQGFIDKCESNGWTVGKFQAPMKNWKSTINTWHRNNKQSKEGEGEWYE